jgi:hypothetical protein
MNLLVKPTEGGFDTFRATRKLRSQGYDADRNCLAARRSSSLLLNSKVKQDIDYSSFAERSSNSRITRISELITIKDKGSCPILL